MTKRSKCLTVAELERVNAMSAHAAARVIDCLAKASVIAGDGNNERRLEAKKCARCFYIGGGIAGRAFTGWACWLCGKDDMHPNTSVPRLCSDCSDAFGLCAHCGGDIEMKFRTKRFGRKAKR
jgi:hypothetical protein